MLCSIGFAQESEETSDEATAAAETWVTSVAADSNADCVAATATGLLLREAAVVAFPAADRSQPVELYRHPHSVWAVALSPDGALVASTDYRGNLSVFSRSAEGWQAGEPKSYEGVCERWTRALAFASDGSALFAGNEAGKLFRIQTDSGEVTKSREIEAAQIMDIAVLEGNQLALAMSSGKLHIVNAETLEPTSGEGKQVSEQALWFCVGKSPQELVAGGADGILRRIKGLDAEPESLGSVSGWATTATQLDSGTIIGTSGGGLYELKPGGAIEQIAEVESGVWGVAAIPGGTVAVGTRKGGLAILQRAWTIQ